MTGATVDSARPLVSIISAVFNEEQNIRDFHAALHFVSFVKADDAKRQLTQIKKILGTRLEEAEAQTETVNLKGKKIYRARFAKLSQAQAVTLCAQLTRMKTGCLPIAP